MDYQGCTTRVCFWSIWRRQRSQSMLPLSTTIHALSVALVAYAVVSQVVMDKDDPSRSRGFGFVTFATEEQMISAAAALDGTEFEGRTISVRLEGAERPANTAPRRVGPKHEAFVGGLAWTTTSEKLRSTFARFGQVLDAKVRTN